eukprot:TRINITY_DN14281_c0_g1_i1.p2 TRINITY_DN14281_c0_g1~~TRINITY_DN14281_c0_g1_i1.p2  ORF type:complete len:52 (+),score=0.86 TRINITY_DN14281_c0_g1_i1:187-342(+)
MQMAKIPFICCFFIPFNLFNSYKIDICCCGEYIGFCGNTFSYVALSIPFIS